MKPWSEGTRATAVMIYGFVMGSVIVGVMLFVALPVLLEDGIEAGDWIAIVGMTVFGVGMSAPTVVMQLIGSFVEAIRAWRKGE